MKTLKLLLAGAALAFSAQASSAAVLHADSVISANQGTCSTPASIFPGPQNGNGCLVDRSDANNALGAGDGDFFALGDGGDITLGFPGTPFQGGNSTVFEVTTNRTNLHDEAVEVFAVLAGVETSFGILTNAVGSSSVFINQEFDSLKFVDRTFSVFANTTSFDGFDLDSVSVAPVPLPATGLMLLGGLAGFGALRRRKKAA